MSFKMNPEGEDIDGIIGSWLNMNLSKSQSGSYVPISVSSNYERQSRIYDFFVVTAKGSL